MASSRHWYYLALCVLFWTLIQLAWCQTKPLPAFDGLRRNSTCKAGHKSCSSCIQMKGCAWCIPNNITDQDVAVCQSESTPCEGGKVSPKGGVTRTGNGDSGEDDYNMILTTDINELSLRVGEKQKIEMTLKVASDGLLDLYYLTDLSTSMKNDLIMLKNLGDELITAMQNKTENFRIGFGTFIDKKMIPYFDIHERKPSEPTNQCQATYSFCNSMSLTEDGKETFLSTVGNASTGDNKDKPEGGLEALMQVLVCEQHIGWRNNAVKIVLYASDDAFHYSGDGKLAGIDKINDAKCHLDPEGKYYAGLTQDYPSVAQIAKAARENNIHVIFAVGEDVLELYKMLVKYVPGSSSTRLASDSSNIIRIITDEFEKLSASVELRAETSREVDVRFVYSCPSGSPGKCEGLMKGQNYLVTAEVMLLRCPSDPSITSRRLVLDAVGLTGNVSIDLDYICSCDCEKNMEVMSPKCNDKGTYTCGQCECPENVYGTTCSCEGIIEETSAACRKPGESIACSGQGKCLCRRCECNDDYYGNFCECVDKGCMLQAGKECSGHGDCKCRKCECHPGWTGDSCNCSTETTGCFRKDSTEQCSGHGVCECDSCKCDSTGHGDDKYFGKYCHDCPTCGGECSKLNTCVKCHLLAQNDKKDLGVDESTCKNSQIDCASANISQVADESMVNTTSFSTCHMMIKSCSRDFFYRTQRDGVHIVLVGDWVCPLKWWEILLSVVVPMVVIGILTLLIWYFINKHKLEMQMKEFDKRTEAAMLAAHENNLYRSPMMEMQNPVFGKAL